MLLERETAEYASPRFHHLVVVHAAGGAVFYVESQCMSDLLSSVAREVCAQLEDAVADDSSNSGSQGDDGEHALDGMEEDVLVR